MITRRGALFTAVGVAIARAQIDPKLLSVTDFETAARDKIVHGAWERISGGAADEITLHWNREAYDQIKLKPRVLVDVSKLDTRVTLLGHELPFPILLAPTGFQRLVHREGEAGVARGEIGRAHV